jgi:hypothetical protein
MAMVRLGIDGIEHSFVSHSDSLFREMVKRDAVLTPTVYVFQHCAPAVVPRDLPRSERGILCCTETFFDHIPFFPQDYPQVLPYQHDFVAFQADLQ